MNEEILKKIFGKKEKKSSGDRLYDKHKAMSDSELRSHAAELKAKIPGAKAAGSLVGGAIHDAWRSAQNEIDRRARVKAIGEEAQIDELSTDTLKSYVNKASDVAKSNYRWKGGFLVNKVPSHKAKKRKQGVLNAIDRIMQREEAPVNAAGAGNVAGLGVGPQGEPGKSAKLMKKPLTRFKKFIGK